MNNLHVEGKRIEKNLNKIFGGSPNKKNKRQSITRSQKSAVRIIQKGRCKDCRDPLTVEEFHHVIPVAKGGKSITRNLVALCPGCHRKRHIKEKSAKSDKRKENE